MYNRYIPQPDGSYRKNRVPDPPQRHMHSRPIPPPPPADDPCPQNEHCQPEFIPCKNETEEKCRPIHNHAGPKHTDAGDFLRKLLPKDLDTGDLLIIILLLLMAGDCEGEKNTALLTLLLYFFL